jgi:hypothetical protein
MLMEGIDELAVNGARAEIFDVGEFELEGLVDPLEEIVLGDEVGRIHQADDCFTCHDIIIKLTNLVLYISCPRPSSFDLQQHSNVLYGRKGRRSCHFDQFGQDNSLEPY